MNKHSHPFAGIYAFLFLLIFIPMNVFAAVDISDTDAPTDTAHMLIPICYDIGNSKSSAKDLRHYLTDYPEKGYVASEVEGISWNPDTATLTLNGYNGGPIYLGSSISSQYMWKDGTLHDRLVDITIEVIGNNTITSNIVTDIFSADYLNITFAGDGNLTFKNTSTDKNTKDVTIGGNVIIDGPTLDFDNFCGTFIARTNEIVYYKDGSKKTTRYEGATFTLRSGRICMDKILYWPRVVGNYIRAENGVNLLGGELVLSDSITISNTLISDATNGALIATNGDIIINDTLLVADVCEFLQDIPILGTMNPDSGKYEAPDIDDSAKIFALTSHSIPDYDFLLSENSYTYDGTAKNPELIDNGLIEGMHYEYVITDNINAGNGKVTVTGIGDFTGEKIIEFTINPRDINDFEIEYEIGDYTFDGTAKEPAARVKGLTALKDYEVLYSNNINPGDSASIIVQGINNYSGTVSKTFSIKSIASQDNANGTGNSTGDGKESGNSNNSSSSGNGNEVINIDGLNNPTFGHKKGNVINDSNLYYVVTKTASKTKAGKASVAGIRKATLKSIKIPAAVTIDGLTYKITDVRKNAFKKNKTVTSVSVGKNVTKIGNSAFEGCSRLKKVTLNSKSLKSIGKKAFKSDKKLRNFTIKSSKLTKIGKQAFKSTSSKLKIKAPKKKKALYIKLIKKSGNKKVR